MAPCLTRRICGLRARAWRGRPRTRWSRRASTRQQLLSPIRRAKLVRSCWQAAASGLGTSKMLGSNGATGILFAGGIDSNGVPVAETDFFSFDTATFDPGPSLITPRWQHQATQLEDNNNRVLITGGIAADGKVIATAEIFDPTTATISNAGTMVFWANQSRCRAQR